jgi:hypothetical protein
MAKQKSNAGRPSRRERIEEARRLERARDRRNRMLAITASVVILAAVVGGGVLLVANADSDEDERSTPTAGDITGEQTWSDLGRGHVETDVDYPMVPPAGGDHSQVWMNCDADIYPNEIADENAVHSLEHGAVWVTYNDDATEADISTLTDRVSATTYSMMSPKADQDAPVILTAWGHQLKLDSAEDERVEEFFTTYVQGAQTPEPGAACTGGLSE